MSTTDTVNPVIVDLAAQLRATRDALAEWKTAEQALLAAIRDELDGYAGDVTGPDGRRILTATYRKVFNAEQAARVLAPEHLAMITEPVVSSALARDLLTPEQYAACQLPGVNPTISLPK